MTLRIALTAIMSLTVVGCDFLLGGEQQAVQDRIRERIEARRSQWESQDIVDYKLTYSQQVGDVIVDSISVYVHTGEVDSINTWPPVSTDAILVTTVDSFFDLIAARVGEEGAEYDASFDDEQGYPTWYTADFIERSSQTIRTISVRELESTAD